MVRTFHLHGQQLAIRVHDIGDARLELDDTLAGRVVAPMPVAERRGTALRVLAGVAAELLTGAAAVGIWAWQSATFRLANKLTALLLLGKYLDLRSKNHKVSGQRLRDQPGLTGATRNELASRITLPGFRAGQPATNGL